MILFLIDLEASYISQRWSAGTMMLDTLKLAQRMESRGVRRDEAEAIAESLGEATRDEIGGRFDRVESRLDRVETRLDGIDRRLDRVESRLDQVETRLEVIDGRLDRVESRLDRTDQRLVNVDSDLRLLKWMGGVIIAGVASLVLRAFFPG